MENRQLLSAVATVTTISVPSSTVLGQTFSIVASVTTPTGAPVTSGTVELYADGSDTGVSAALNSGGFASFTFGPANTVYVGTYTLGAEFLGTTTDAASTTAVNANLDITSPTYTTKPDGLQIATVTAGTGAGAVTGQYLTVQYTGFYQSNGSVFDESAEHAPPEFSYTLNATPEQVISGFDEGTTAIKAGGTVDLVIPSNLGYNDGNVRIFVIHCLSIGTSTTIGASSHLTFDQLPTAAEAGTLIAPPMTVDVEDAHNNLVATDSSSVTLSIASGPTGASLSGTTSVQAYDGIATFSNLYVSLPGNYTFKSVDANLTSAVSSTVTVISPSGLTPGSGAAYTITGSPGAQTLNVTAGTVTLSSDQSTTLPGVGLEIQSGAHVVLSSDQRLAALQILGAGNLNVASDTVFVAYGSSDPISTIAGYLKTGYNAGGWNGNGIFSSSAAANKSYALGYADGADGIVAGLSSGQIKIKYTLYGDTNLDGVVNGSDFGNVAAHFGKSVTGWDKGDLNFDGLVNGTDFGLLAANFGKTAVGAATLEVINSDSAAIVPAGNATNLQSQNNWEVVPQNPKPAAVLATNTETSVPKERRRHHRH
jgi:hypothetical protein